MKLPDPLQHPENYFLVQFSIDDTGLMQPLHVSTVQAFQSHRYPDLPFVGVAGSKYGVRKIKKATHWALVYMDDDDTIMVVHRGRLDALISRKRIMPFGQGIDAFISARGSTHYFSMAITREAYPEALRGVRLPIVDHFDNVNAN